MFKQIELPYGFDALEPSIDTKTMEIHYGKHHEFPLFLYQWKFIMESIMQLILII